MEYPPNHTHPRTAQALQALKDENLLHEYKADDQHPVSFCKTPGLRHDTVRSAEKAADNTGRIQVIQYEFPVKIQTNIEGEDTFMETRLTFVLPDLARRRAFLTLR